MPDKLVTKRQCPSLVSLLSGFVSFMMYFIVLQFFTVKIFVPLPFGKRTRTRINKKLLQLFAKFIVYTDLNLKLDIRGSTKEIFTKPVFIVANHQTLLDVPLMLMLNHNLIVITNDWLQHTWSKPLIRNYVEFVTVSDGLETGLDQVAKACKNGDSVLVFPEAARLDKGVGRFHKGAFYMAEKLNADILPVVLHGSAGIHGKKWFYLRRGRMVMKIGDVIKPDDPRFGTGYAERSKRIADYFRAEYNKIEQEG